MNLLPKHGADFQKADYWREFFSKRKDPFEWYGTYWDLAHIFQKYVKTTDQILMVGCGNSELSEELYDKQNCKLITNVDISENVIERMKKRSEQAGRSMLYEVGDVTKMEYKSEKFNVVIDKGTLDAMMVDEEVQTVDMIEKMYSEIERCIANFGRYIIITLAQEHIARHFSKYFYERNGWVVRIHEHVPEQKEGQSMVLPVFVIVLTRMKPIPGREVSKIMEIQSHQAEKAERVENDESLISFIKSKQEWSQLKGHVSSIKPTGDEVNFKLYSQLVYGIPRFDLYVVDCISNKSEMAFFIVSSGREFDWLYATKQGRLSLAKQIKEATNGGFKRLIVVLLNMAHTYGNMESVKEELSWLVGELKTKSFTSRQVPFLTESTEVENRTILGRGKSELSGNYIIEESAARDSTGDEHTYRRLIFEKQPTLIQSECRMIEKVIRKGKKKQKKRVLDVNFIATEYYYGIILAAEVLKTKESPKSLIVGLGGGCLTSFMANRYSNFHLNSVEIDPEVVKIAKNYFNFKESSNVITTIGDGQQILADAEAESIDLLVLDVDQKDPGLALRCPPECFVSEKALESAKSALSLDGVMVVNLVCRDSAKRADIVEKCRRVFDHCHVMDCSEDVNKILVLSRLNLKDQLLEAGKSIRGKVEDDACDQISFLLSTMST